MNISKTEARRKFIINIVFYTIVLLILYLAVAKALPLVMPFFIAFVISALLNHPINRIHRKFPKLSKGLIGGIMFTLILLIVIGVLVLSGVQIANYVSSFFKWVSGNLKNIPSYIIEFKNNCFEAVSKWPESIRKPIEDTLNKYISVKSVSNINVSSLFTGAVGGVWTFAKSIPNVAIATIIALISTYFMLGSYDNVVLFFRAQLSDRNKALAQDTKEAFRDTIGKYVKAYAKIVFITFLELLASFYIMNFAHIYEGKYIPLIALGIAIVDILPILGTGSIVAPWAIISFIQGNIAMGIALLVMWVLISIIRQYIEPKLVGKQIGLNPLITLLGMYVGLKLFGAIGMFLLPISIIILKALQDSGKIKIWNTPEKVDATEDNGNRETEKPKKTSFFKKHAKNKKDEPFKTEENNENGENKE